MQPAPSPAPSETSEPKTDEITIVLADDHVVVRSALRMLLEAEPDLEVVAEAATRRRVPYVRGHEPDVLVLDLNMPGRGSLEALPEIRERRPRHRSSS